MTIPERRRSENGGILDSGGEVPNLGLVYILAATVLDEYVIDGDTSGVGNNSDLEALIGGGPSLLRNKISIL